MSTLFGIAAFVALNVAAFLWIARSSHMAATDADWRERWGPPRRRAWTPVGDDKPPSGPVDIGGGSIGVPPMCPGSIFPRFNVNVPMPPGTRNPRVNL